MTTVAAGNASQAEPWTRQALVCGLFLGVFLLDFLRINFGLPRVAMFLPELLSGFAFLMFLEGFARARLQLHPAYLVLFLLLFLTLTVGLFVSEATIGPLVGGLRLYGKYVPFFLLPLVCRFSPEQLKFQLALVLGLAMLQFPVAFLQRFVIYAGLNGDMARGTFSSGSQNAVVLLCVLAVVVAAYHKRRLSLPVATGIGLLLCTPPMLGEVKGAFLLLPLALLIPTLLVPSKQGMGTRLAGVALAGSLVLGLFAAVYNYAESSTIRYQRGDNHRVELLDFITDPRRLVAYLAPQLGGSENERIGRVDGVFEPFREFADEPLKLMTGLGLGALSNSPFKEFSADQHRQITEDGRARVTAALLLWEIGLLGTLLVLVGLYLVWRDARTLRHEDSVMGAIGLGYMAVVVIFVGAMFWKNTMTNNAVMYLFAYFAGHVAASAQIRRRRLAAVPYVQDSVRPATISSQNDVSIPAILNEPGRHKLA